MAHFLLKLLFVVAIYCNKWFEKWKKKDLGKMYLIDSQNLRR